uniref:FAM65 N-terminal domain-containing protein n=1 Tax=Meloidogyne incognita TaxID=6306 RepID=A0A914MKT6_MELIC
MGAIEAEACGMLGRLQFHVQAIIGFARICTGDVFEVCIRHGHQRWRTRGKTQPDRSQRWDLQPPIASIQVLWNVPVQVRVLEIGFLRARCLSERQFDPAKFAAAQPQLVTMNLNSSGSLKLRLVVTWLPLLSSNIPSQFNNMLNQKQLQVKENGFNNNNNHASLSQQNSLAQRPEPPERSAMNTKLRQHQSQVLLSSVNNNNQKIQQNGVSIWRTTSSNSPSAFPSQGGNNKAAWQNNNNTKNNNQANSINNNNEQINGGKLNDVHQPSEHSPSSITTNGTNVENGPATKVCLRDKKRQREQRLKLGASVGAALGGGGGGISRESSKTEKDKWRCSSTTLLDEVYKDLSKSIPTIDDLSALHSSKPSSVCGGSLGHSKNTFCGPSSSSSVSDGHGARSGAKRIFSFVKRGGHDKSSLDRQTASDWRKSVSLAQIPSSRSMEIEQNSNSLKSSNRNKSQYRLEVEEPEEPDEFDENEREEGLCRGGTSSPKSRDLHSPTSQTTSSSYTKEISEFQSALHTVDALLDMIECLRVYLAKLRPSEFTELVAFEAAMLNWEACLKLNRSGILCQLDNFTGKTENNKKRQNSIQLKKQKHRLATGNLNLINNHSSATTLFSNENRVNNQQQQHSPSTASDHTEDNDGCVAGTSTIKYEQRHQQHVLDHISENDSGIDSLRHYQSPYNSYASSVRRLEQNNEGNCIVSSQLKERRKSLVGSTMLDNDNGENLKNSKEKSERRLIITATGSAQMDACLAIHLDGARQPLEIICQVQGSPFEYTMTKMLYRMEGVETIALESMLGLLQDILAQCQPNPQNVLLQLGLQFQLQQCWLSACKTENEFLLASASILRDKLRPICEPIVRNHYPKLIEKVLDSLFSLLIDNPTGRKKQSNNHQLPVTIFQFVSLFRGKQFSAFIENLSHEGIDGTIIYRLNIGPRDQISDKNSVTEIRISFEESISIFIRPSLSVLSTDTY